MSTASEPKPLQLHRLSIRNWMRIEAIDIECNGNHVAIKAKNGRGKTSIAEAFAIGIRGRSNKTTPTPIHRGKSEATIEEVLSNDTDKIVVKRRFTPNGDTVVVTAADGSKITSPQKMLDTLWCEHAVRPALFMEMRPQDQLDEFLRVYEVKPPVAAVERITGEKHPALPDESASAYLERLIADKRGLYYVRRLEQGRIVDQKRDALIEQRRIVEGLGGPVKPSDKPPSATELLKQIAGLQQEQENRRAAFAEAADARRQADNDRSAVERLEKQRANEATRVRILEKQQEEIRRQIEEGNAGILALDKRITEGRDIIQENTDEADRLADAAEALPDVSPKITALNQQVVTVEAAQKAVASRQVATEQMDRLAKETERAEADHKRLDDILGELRGERDHLLDGTEIDIPGISVGDGELLFNKVVFRQASTAERIMVGCELAMKQNPRIGMLIIDRAESLDDDSRVMVRRLAEKHGWRVFELVVTQQDKMEIEIIDADPPANGQPRSELFAAETAGPYAGGH